MSKKNKPKMVTIQVIKGFREGRVLNPGDRIEVVASRAKIIEQCGYGVRVDPEAPYTHPAAKPEHQFKEVKFDEPEKEKEVKPEKTINVEAVPSLEHLSFLNKSHLKALKRNGIKVLNDVEGWDLDGLTGINGVSRKTSQKLLDAYNMHCNVKHSKDSGMEVKNK